MPETAIQTLKDQTVKISTLCNEQCIVADYRFEDCRIEGPAVTCFQENVHLDGCQLDGTMDAILWEIAPDREQIVGTVVLKNCWFERCTFVNIGIAGLKDLVDYLKQNLAP